MPPWLALLAMFIQFVASFGHFDPGDFQFLERGHSSLTLVAAHRSVGSSGSGMAADTDCPICASITLLGSSALPEDLRVPMPAVRHAVVLASLDALHLTPPAHLLFDTRGPPLSR
ncbi:MAG TPA: hypothetical protein VKV32_08890 [Stellaceae bacterium]|nr:hypothetical protein [Stellaceae bacterium]